MIDIRLIRENPDLVRENIRKKFQDAKLPLVDEVIELDKANRAAINEASNLRAERNSLSKKIGMLMGQAKKDPSKLEEAEAVKAQVTAQAARLAELEKQEEELEAKIHKIMLTIPQIIDPSVPLGPDDSCNVEVQRFGEAVVPDFPIPYHTEIMERFDGIDLDAARRVSGNGFYYLMGDIARLHEAVLAYARDFMIGKGFTYCIPPFMIHGNVVEGTAVRKGQAILSLASSSLSDGNVAAKAKYAYENAKKEYERMETLVGDKIVSAKDFEQARLNYENAKVAWEAVAGKQTANGVSVVSPINGYLKNLQVKEGDYVTVGQPLATISQNSRLVLRAEVSEKYYNYLPSIQSANFRTPYDNVTYKLSDLRGHLLSYGKASDTNSFYVSVTFEFDNKGVIIPGSFVEIYLLTAPIQNVISVPVSALIEEQGVYSVFVRVHEEAYKKVPVTLGADNGSEVQILSGLNAGDEVVTVGAYQIKLASASNAIPAHTHNH